MASYDVASTVHQSLVAGQRDPFDELELFRIGALEGSMYCENVGCEVVGQLKDFKVCPQCKTARYCGKACQEQDWTTGGHKATCGKFVCAD